MVGISREPWNFVQQSYVSVSIMRYLLVALFTAATTLYPAFGQDNIAIVNVTLIDGTDNPSRPNCTVIVQGEKIVAITCGLNKPPTGTKVIDGVGKFLIPGLWNNDLHGPAYGDAKPQLEELVSYGITTVRDMGAPLDDILRLRDETASGTLVGPRLCSRFFLTGHR